MPGVGLVVEIEGFKGGLSFDWIEFSSRDDAKSSHHNRGPTGPIGLMTSVHTTPFGTIDHAKNQNLWIAVTTILVPLHNNFSARNVRPLFPFYRYLFSFYCRFGVIW
jgi:hypothetical protein